MHAKGMGSPKIQQPPMPSLIRDYNLHMGGSDRNAQQRAYYSSQRPSDRYWWPLFIFLLDAATLNAYKLYELDDALDHKLSRSEFIRNVATTLMQNPMGNTKYYDIQTTIHTNASPRVSQPTHHYIHLEKKRLCQACKITKCVGIESNR